MKAKQGPGKFPLVVLHRHAKRTQFSVFVDRMGIFSVFGLTLVLFHGRMGHMI